MKAQSMAAAPGASFDLQSFTDSRELRPLHWQVLALVGLVMFFDGYDVFLVGKIAPAIAQGFGIHPKDMQIVILLQQIGLAVGAFFVSPLFDRFGRRRMIILSAIVFGILTTATAFSRSIVEMAVLRGLAGLFLSGVLPAGMALISEFTPAKRRATFIAISLAGYSAGSAAGAGAALLVPSHGWQAGFLIGGILPLLLAIPLWLWLPESLGLRATKNPQDPTIPDTLRKLDPDVDLTGVQSFSAGPGKPKKAGDVRDLVRDGRATNTAIFFLCCFFSMGTTAMLAAWLPTFFQEMGGISIQRFAIAAMIGFAGGLVGTLTVGMLMDRFGPYRVVPFYYFAMAAALFLLGRVPFGTPIFIARLICWSFGQTGGQSGINMLAAQYYPVSIRSTGIGWMGGAGRIGGVLVPLFGGWALSHALTLPTTMALVAIAPFIVGLLFLILRPGADRTSRPSSKLSAAS